ncbi:MAG: DNA/RNA helicase domain-containing protein [Erysipelotrichaceae bacterium]
MTEINEFKFNEKELDNIKELEYGNNWPVVYILKNDKEAYVGESVNAYKRMGQHLKNEARKDLKTISIISDSEFNKSAILDMEALLIKYMSGENKYILQNLQNGQLEHNYYNKEHYKEKFSKIWDKLKENGIAEKGIHEIENSEIFKYSPYKTLTVEQHNVVTDILSDIKYHVDRNEKATFIVRGSAGTGKTILALYLLKLISDVMSDDYCELDKEDSDGEFSGIQSLKNTNELRAAIVVPVTSLRGTLKKVVKGIKGLASSNVIGPSESTKGEFNVLIVDEAHRLRRDKNVMPGVSNNFKTKNELFGLDDANELDWIRKFSDYQILFYDINQSIRSSDIPSEEYKNLSNNGITHYYNLSSQMRCLGGNDYINYIKDLLNDKKPKYISDFGSYEFYLYEDIEVMVNKIKALNKEYSLCRMVAGYGWEWSTKNYSSYDEIVKDNKSDIHIKGTNLIWNTTANDWVNSINAINEVGCIHTVQGYDINYCGVIFGPEISYDDVNDRIIVYKDNYKDKVGKKCLSKDSDLKTYITNIYEVLLTRGIHGTYIYVCDDKLREYLKDYIRVVR